MKKTFVLIGIMIFAFGMFGCGNKGVKAPYPSDHYVGTAWKTVSEEFSEAGFKNIKTQEVKDIDMYSSANVDTVVSVSINGETDFSVDNEYPKDAEVIITYHMPAVFKSNIHVNFHENLIFSKYDVDLIIDDESIATMKHGEDQDLEVEIAFGQHEVKFAKSSDSTTNTKVTLDAKCRFDACYTISCDSDKISVTEDYIDYDLQIEGDQIKTTTSWEDYYYKNYEEVVAALKEMGFTNITVEPIYDIVFGITKDGSVETIYVDGKDGFKRGEVFANDVAVVVKYHTLEENNPEFIAAKQKAEEERKAEEARKAEEQKAEESRRAEEQKAEESRKAEEAEAPVYYSTNNSETVKNGNTGVYAYRKDGSNYDLYYIIDFDEGYVYFFTEGNGEGGCERLKIDSGDLNHVLVVTYHDGEDVWSNGLHFKFKNNPTHLIMEDNDHFEYDYYPTNLNEALQIRDTKTIYNY